MSDIPSVEHRITKIETSLYGANGTEGFIEKVDHYIKSRPTECYFLKEKANMVVKKDSIFKTVALVGSQIGTMVAVIALLLKVFGVV